MSGENWGNTQGWLLLPWNSNAEKPLEALGHLATGGRGLMDAQRKLWGSSITHFDLIPWPVSRTGCILWILAHPTSLKWNLTRQWAQTSAEKEVNRSGEGKGRRGKDAGKMAHINPLQYMQDIEDFFSATSSPTARRQKIYSLSFACAIF